MSHVMFVNSLVGLSPLALLTLEGCCDVTPWDIDWHRRKRTGFGPDPRNLGKQPCNKTWPAMCVCLILTNMWSRTEPRCQYPWTCLQQCLNAHLSWQTWAWGVFGLAVCQDSFWWVWQNLETRTKTHFPKAEVHVSCILSSEDAKPSVSMPPTTAAGPVRGAQHEILQCLGQAVQRRALHENVAGEIIVYEIQRCHAWIKWTWEQNMTL